MAHSIEVRVPLVDHVLLSELAAFHGDFGPGGGKSLLAFAPKEPLPDHVLNRAKTGFQTPVHVWMQSAAENVEDTSVPWARNWSRVVLKNWMSDAASKASRRPSPHDRRPSQLTRRSRLKAGGGVL
jgi:asparagine synthetase B (glutamine-hydrolysing)